MLRQLQIDEEKTKYDISLPTLLECFFIQCSFNLECFIVSLGKKVSGVGTLVTLWAEQKYIFNSKIHF